MAAGGAPRAPRRARSATTIGVLLLATACGGVEDGEAASGGAALRVGDRGARVAAATEYFMKYGYFENEELEAEYPAWRPLVGRPPVDGSVYGEELRLAVSVLQARAGLPVTGSIDADTQALMDTPRCGVPDSFKTAGEDKWSYGTTFSAQSDHRLKYAFTFFPTCPQRNPSGLCSNFNGIDPNQVKAAIRSAMATWAAKTNATFTEDNNNPDFTINFIDNTPAGSLASSSDTHMWFHNGERWSLTPSSGTIDLQSVAAHEVGHVLGFDHSSVVSTPQPLMWPEIPTNTVLRTLQPDDEDAVAASPYTSWKPVTGTPGEAVDIGSSVVSGSEFTWKVGNGSNNEGFLVWRWNEPTRAWVQINAPGGKRIDVGGMTPWVVTNAGIIKSGQVSLPNCQNGCGWTTRGKCGTAGFVDVGANPNGQVWALGGDPDSNGNYAVYRFIGGSSSSATNCSLWRLVDGRAVFVDVAPDGSPWVVNSAGAIYHRNGVTGTGDGTNWSKYGGVVHDVALGAITSGVSGTRWVTDPGNSVYSSNIQPLGTIGSPVAPEQNHWYRLDGGGVSITVGAAGLPWVVGADGSVWRRRPF